MNILNITGIKVDRANTVDPDRMFAPMIDWILEADDHEKAAPFIRTIVEIERLKYLSRGGIDKVLMPRWHAILPSAVYTLSSISCEVVEY